MSSRASLQVINTVLPALAVAIMLTALWVRVSQPDRGLTVEAHPVMESLVRPLSVPAQAAPGPLAEAGPEAPAGPETL